MQSNVIIMQKRNSPTSIRHDLTAYTINSLNKPEFTNGLSAVIGSQLVDNFREKLVLSHHSSNELIAI